MNCDEAFELMTDRERVEHPELRWHLDLCPRCRQMRETLEPALSLFGVGEADADLSHGIDEGQSLFGGEHSEAVPMGSRLSPEAIRMAAEAATDLDRRSPHSAADRWVTRRSNPWGALVRYTAIGMLALLGVWGFSALDSHPGNSSTRPRSSAMPGISQMAQCSWIDRSQLEAEGASPTVRSVVLSCVACHLESRRIDW